jgi:hypothetical protein
VHVRISRGRSNQEVRPQHAAFAWMRKPHSICFLRRQEVELLAASPEGKAIQWRHDGVGPSLSQLPWHDSVLPEQTALASSCTSLSELLCFRLWISAIDIGIWARKCSIYITGFLTFHYIKITSNNAIHCVPSLFGGQWKVQFWALLQVPTRLDGDSFSVSLHLQEAVKCYGYKNNVSYFHCYSYIFGKCVLWRSKPVKILCGHLVQRGRTEKRLLFFFF